MKNKYSNCKWLPAITHLKLDKIIPEEATTESLLDIHSKNLHKLDEDVSNVTEFKIPPIMHTVWVTNKNHPNEIEDKYIEMLQNNIKLLANNNDVNWRFILWTNDPSLIPHTIDSLSSSGFEVRLVDEVSTDRNLLNKIYDFIDQGYHAHASDSIRYLALQEHGGIYIDTDYELFKVPYKLMKTYDFVTGHIHWIPYIICPEINIIMTKPHHPILEETVSLLRANLLDYENASELIKHPCNLRHAEALLIGRLVCPSFYQKAHQEGNVDIIFGDRIMTDDWRQSIIGTIPEDPYSEEYSSSNVPLFGRDHYASRWHSAE